MAFYPAHCDNECKNCEKNKCGWCIWKDRATPYYNDFEKAIKAENSHHIKDYVDVSPKITSINFH